MSVHMIYYKDGAKMMRPILTATEYRNLRNSQRSMVAAIRQGDTSLKQRLIQMNYSCLPNDDGSLKGSTRLSTSVGMDIDHIAQDQMEATKERILARKDELGLLMLELSARGEGYHLVFRRRPSMSQEENLRWASRLLGVEYDKGAKDITRVFFTTTAEDLLFLDDEIFRTLSPEPSPLKGEGEEKNLSPTLSKGEGPSSLGEERGDRRFRGIPYSAIIEEYWSKTGGTPVEGERNVRLHQLAVNLRSICDNKKEVLMQIMPRLGLSETELQSIVESACKENPKGISKKMQEIIRTLSDSPLKGEEEQTEEQSSNCEIVQSSNFKRLPIGLKESLIGVPETMHMPVLCAVLPIAGAYADGVEVEYCTGERMRLGLMSIIVGEQASGKSVCKSAIDIWKRPLAESDALARLKEEQWREMRKGRKANEKAPDDPKVLIRMLPVTVSCSTLLRRLKNAQGHILYSFGEELDTLRKTNAAGSWSSKYDIYRLSFDQGEWGQDYNSDQAESGVVNVAYNWTMLGTPGALTRCFRRDNVENGLSSRVLISEMPDGAFAPMPTYGHRNEEDEGRVVEAAQLLSSIQGFIDTPLLRQAIGNWVEQKRQQAAKDIDYITDTYRRRAAVIGFRCGVIHHLLSQTETESEDTIDFALMMAEHCLHGQVEFFGDMLKSQKTDERYERYGSNKTVFEQLPTEFSYKDLMALKPGASMTAIRKTVSRWYREKWVVRLEMGRWKKCAT